MSNNVMKQIQILKSQKTLIKYDLNYKFDMNQANIKIENMKLILSHINQNIHILLKTAFPQNESLLIDSFIQLVKQYFSTISEFFNLLFLLNIDFNDNSILDLVFLIILIEIIRLKKAQKI